MPGFIGALPPSLTPGLQALVVDIHRPELHHSDVGGYRTIGPALALDFLILSGLRIPSATALQVPAPPYVVVLGIAQDGGYPQAGATDDTGWADADRTRHVACLAIVDPSTGERWMIEATPDFKYQLHSLDQRAPCSRDLVLDGILLTHAHIGHYLGLAQVGHEVMGARGLAVYAMPRMSRFLRENGPWDQLVRYGNIVLQELQAGRPVSLNAKIRVIPFLVPHRQEYSEVAGFHIEGPDHSVLFIPDIDSWEEWDSEGTRIEDCLLRVDRAYLDGTFFADGEIPGRDMSSFPHPFIEHSMQRFANLPLTEKSKIRFIHLNHTNPALDPESDASREIREAGFGIAGELERFGL